MSIPSKLTQADVYQIRGHSCPTCWDCVELVAKSLARLAWLETQHESALVVAKSLRREAENARMVSSAVDARDLRERADEWCRWADLVDPIKPKPPRMELVRGSDDALEYLPQANDPKED